MKKEHSKKMLAPIVITIFVVLYYGLFITLAVFSAMPLLFKILFGIIPLMLIGAIIYVLKERINEIRSGEEDDLSNY